MAHGAGGAGNVLRRCVTGFAGEKGADLEKGGIQKGQGASEQKGTSPVTCRGIK